MGFSTLDAKLYKGTKVSTGGSTCKPGWSQDHPDLHQTCKKMFIYTLVKKILYAKLTYCDHPNKNIEYPNLRITKIWVQ